MSVIKLFLISIALLFLANCNTSVQEAVSKNEQELTASASKACSDDQCPCETPVGSVPHAAEVTVYSSQVVEYGKSCQDISSKLYCDNGLLTPQMGVRPEKEESDQLLAGLSFTCKVGEIEPCVVGNSLIQHNDSFTFYSSNEVGCNDSCEDVKQVRTCINGKLQGDSQFRFTTCQPKECRCRLPDETGYMSLGGQVELYHSTTAACGSSCAASKQLRTCITNGTGDSQVYLFDGDASYKFNSCKEATNCFCPLSGYGNIPNDGDTVPLFDQATYDCGEDIDQFKNEFRCEGMQLYRNGVPYNKATDPKAPAIYHASIRNDCKGCKTPWGVTIPEGEKVIGFHVAEAKGSCGRGCKSQEMVCEKGKLSGDPDFFNSQVCTNTCAEEGGGAPPRLCLLPWQNSFVTPGAKIPMWKKSTVPCGESCFDHYKLATCVLETGAFDVGPEYLYKSCTELCFDN